MDDLIARLEAATGPDREIDEDIERWRHDIEGYHGRILLPFGHVRYTSSIDAALTLVPDGFQFYVETGVGAGDARAFVWVDYPHRISGIAQRYSLAIALCIAALKARACQHLLMSELDLKDRPASVLPGAVTYSARK